MRNLILIKVGGSVITNIRKESTPDMESIHRLSGEIERVKARRQLILGHGSGSFGHIPAKRYKVNLGLINRKSAKGASLAQDAAARLHRIFMKQLWERGTDPFSFPPSGGVISSWGRITEWNTKPLLHALRNGLLPVTYGDVCLDAKQGVAIISTEEAFRYIAIKMRPKLVVTGTDVDGVYAGYHGGEKKLIESIDGRNIRHALKHAGASGKVDVTGGMASKIATLYTIAKETGATCCIVNAKVPGRLYKAAMGIGVRGTKIRV